MTDNKICHEIGCSILYKHLAYTDSDVSIQAHDTHGAQYALGLFEMIENYFIRLYNKALCPLHTFGRGSLACQVALLEYETEIAASRLLKSRSRVELNCARSCATAYLLMGAQHTLRAGIVRVDRELFNQIIGICVTF